MKKKLLVLFLMVVVVGSLIFPVSALAVDPVVDITVSAAVVSIINSQDTWAIGPVLVDAVKYFSVDNLQDDDYSQVENTGNCTVDVEIRGTNFEGGDYDWTLSNTGTPGDQIYSLHANTPSGGANYTTIVKSSAYTYLVEDLPATGADKYDWSMMFTAPSAFNAADPGASKAATVTLVAAYSG